MIGSHLDPRVAATILPDAGPDPPPGPGATVVKSATSMRPNDASNAKAAQRGTSPSRMLAIACDT